MSFPTDLEIAREATAKPMAEIADMMGIGEHLLQPYGSDLDPARTKPQKWQIVFAGSGFGW